MVEKLEEEEAEVGEEEAEVDSQARKPKLKQMERKTKGERQKI